MLDFAGIFSDMVPTVPLHPDMCMIETDIGLVSLLHSSGTNRLITGRYFAQAEALSSRTDAILYQATAIRSRREC
jgi:hypothetical protein